MFVKTWRDSFKVLYNESEIINRNKLILIVANVKKLCLLKQELYSVLIMINVKTVTVEREIGLSSEYSKGRWGFITKENSGA